MNSNGQSTQADRLTRRDGRLKRLGGYVATTVGAGILATPSAEAAVVPIDIGPSGFNIGGVNAGLPSQGKNNVPDFPFAGAGELRIRNGTYNNFSWGLYFYNGESGGGIATNNSLANPKKLSVGDTIDQSLFVGGGYGPSLFKVNFWWSGIVNTAPDFGPGSYIGFRTAGENPRFGYFEVTWDGTTSQFEILSAAYESDPNTALTIGGGPAPVPEIDPSGFASVASMAIGSLAMLEQRRRKRAAAAVMA